MKLILNVGTKTKFNKIIYTHNRIVLDKMTNADGYITIKCRTLLFKMVVNVFVIA